MTHRAIRPLAAALGALLGLLLIAAAAPGCSKSRSRGGGGGGGRGGGGGSTSPVALVLAEQQNVVEALCACTWESEGYDSEADCVASADAAGAEELACAEEAYASNPGELRPYMDCLRAELSDAAACVGTSDCSDAALSACLPAEDPCGTDDPAVQAFEDDIEACLDDGSGDPPPTVGLCPESSIGSSTGPNVTTGNTAGRSADSTGSCGGSDAPDVTVGWTVPSSGTWVIDTAGSDFDTVLYVTDGCDGAELACNDDADGLQSRVTVEATAGQSLIVVVDGFGSGDEGAFVLNISLAP